MSEVIEGNVSQEFVCKCGKTTIWIVEGIETLPCPKCGRKYIAFYSKRKLGLIAKELKLSRFKNVINSLLAYIKSLNNV